MYKFFNLILTKICSLADGTKKQVTDPLTMEGKQIRRLIETVGNQLINNLHVKKVWAHDLWHLTNRIRRKILAHTLRHTFPNGNAHFF